VTKSIRSSSGQEPEINSASLSDAQFKKLVDVISRSQQSYRDLIDNLDQAVFTLSLEGEVRVANRRLTEILKVSFQDLIGHRLNEFVEKPTLTEAERAFPSFAEKGHWAGRLPVRFKGEKEDRHFDCWLQAVAEGGQITSVSGWGRDVSAEQASEVRFSELFESLQEGLLLVTPDGQILDVNPSLVRMLGFESKEQLKTVNFRDVYDDPAQRDSLVAELTEKGMIQDHELVLKRKDGARFHCLTSGFVIRDVSGRIVQLQGTFVDISERIEIEKQLRKEQEFVRRLVACFPDVIGVLDRDGKFTYVSQRVKDVLGCFPEEYIGETLGMRAHPEDCAKLTAFLEDVVIGRETGTQIEYRARHADGSWRTLRASAGPLFDETGRISGIVASARDVTDLKQAEQQMILNEKFAAMGQMMAGAAHELNNPLTAILGVADLLRERATDNAMRRHTEMVLQQARRAAMIVQNLLAFSRPSTQTKSKVNLAQIVQNALKLHDASLRQKRIGIQLDAAMDVPVIDCDPRTLTQAFVNLIVNAEQAISSTRDHGTLKVIVRRVDDKASVTFVDDGPGIPPENIEKIFNPFFTTKRPGGGSGLGLTICLAVIKEHGGTIDVRSTEGEGASFQALVPLALRSSASAPPRRPATGHATPATDLLRGHSLLVVDDEESICEIVQEGLVARGMKIDGASSSEAALAMVSANAYDVILCDLNLPGLRGEQLYEQMCARGGTGGTHFVFMTGDLLDSATAAKYGTRGARVIQKPFQVAALASVLAELLDPHPAGS
jgi:PAS domain S-box-containing protein